MSIHEISYPSQNGRDTIKAWSYSPLGKPRGIIQIIHDFGEHSRRYMHMILAFQEAGFVVYADDHIGHGKTGVDSKTLGDPHSKDYHTYIDDEKSLHDIAVKEYPHLPFLLFGHSWGSLIARAYAAIYGEEVTAVGLCGVVSHMKGCDIERHDPDMKAAVEEDPYQPAGEWMEKTFLDLTERIPTAISPNAWIARDMRIVADHTNDPFNSFDVTLQLIWDFVQMYDFVQNEEWAQKVPKTMPFYLISGDQDPCGNYGEGTYYVANLLISSGHKATVHVYPGYRHEIHNELDLRCEVEKGIIDFFNNSIH